MKKLKNVILVLVLSIIMMSIIGIGNKVNAESAGPLYLGIVKLRQSGYGYQLSPDTNKKSVFKIGEYDSLDDTTIDLSKLIYCIKAGAGFGSDESTITAKVYNQRFNLKAPSSIESPYSNVLQTGENFNKLLWVLDNLYTEIGSNNAESRNAYLQRVIPEANGSPVYGDYELLTDDDIDVIQQVAIWYFTNPDDSYHISEDALMLYINPVQNVPGGQYSPFSDLDSVDGEYRQNAARTLYKYLVTNAQGDYTPVYNTTDPIELVAPNSPMVLDGTNYIAGPYKINELLNNQEYTLEVTYKNHGTEHEIVPTLAVKDGNNIVNTDKTIKELASEGTEFYLIVPTTYQFNGTNYDVNGIDISITASYTNRTAMYWSVENAPNTEQPVVIIEDTPHNFPHESSVVVQKPFDLSLRKFISAINGVELVDGEGNYLRAPVPDVTPLNNGSSTTAEYNHPKNPIKVAVGDIITYTIRVYNEGQIDGYVTEITDHLPANLRYVEYSAESTYYDKNYAWEFDGNDQKTLKTSILSYDNEVTAGENKLVAFDGTELSYKDVKIACEVIYTENMPNKITNIAEITGFTDGDKNAIEDRDSQEDSLTDSNTANEDNLPTEQELPGYKDAEIRRGEDYIPGQQDDDDFEKVMLKEFDLALRKFITEVNGKEVKDRVPDPDVSTLLDGVDPLTAEYNHPKTPVKVAIGDVVIYTIRVYNEGEVDGYATEITDHLPAQLEYIDGHEINEQYGWNANGQTVKTSYLATGTSNLLKAFDGEKLDYKELKIACRVKYTDNMPKKITNIAEITGFTDSHGNPIEDRDSQESSLTDSNTVNEDNLPSNENLPTYKDTEIASGEDYIPGQQDDDDFEKVMLKEFDLALRKFITGVNGKKITDREPDPDVSTLLDGVDPLTATYNHTKTPVKVSIGDTVVYTIRVYNEGEVDGYASEITDHLPEQLEFVENSEINTLYGWIPDTENPRVYKTNYLSKDNEIYIIEVPSDFVPEEHPYYTPSSTLLLAYNPENMTNGPHYRDLLIECKVVSTDNMPNKITNIAEITDDSDAEGNPVKDRDNEEEVQMPSDLPGYKDDEINKPYVPGQEDDDDFEKITLKEFDLALRKYIVQVGNKTITNREPSITAESINDLRTSARTTASYNHIKEPVGVSIGDRVVYTIEVFNEGDEDGYASEITDHLPAQLRFIENDEINKKFEWGTDDGNNQIVRTSYLSKERETSDRTNKIVAFNGTTIASKKIQIACEVVETEPMASKITNIAEISNFTNGNGVKVVDRDSGVAFTGDKKLATIPVGEELEEYKGKSTNSSDLNKSDYYYEGQEDDDDFEKLVIKEFDLALRKFITKVNDTEVTTRYPVFEIDDEGNYRYNHTKEPVLVSNSNIVTYTIRVYNEGEVNGYASLIKDDIPEGLEYLPENETNIEYRWIMLDKDGNEVENIEEAVSIATDYLSKEQEKTAKENLLLAFDKENMEEPDHKDVKVAFKVIEASTSDRIIINQAQISDDSDEEGNPIKDTDSEPDIWNDGEDDQDIEKIKVQYFDLSLRKWVTQAIVIENGETTVTETGHKAEDDPEGIVKVDIKKKKINSVIVKFRYRIRVTNEGQIPGYVKEITDYIPEGLRFIQEDNPEWTQIEENVITTDQAKDVLLKPGESVEVEVLLTWINNEENMGLKVNIAEISKDYNEYGAPDIDSTPNNKKDGEDDIDDAPVMLSAATGQIRTYTLIAGMVLVILGTGIVLIKRILK